MNQSGFSLMSAMVAILVGGVVTMGMVEIIKNLNNSLSFSHASNEVNNQIYELRVGLTDPATCFQNLGVSNRVNLAAGTFALTQPFRYLNAAGGLDVTTTMLPVQGGTQRALRAYATRTRIYRKPAATNLAIIELEFSSPSNFSGLNSVYRELPISVSTDAAGNLTACSTGVPAFTTGGTTGTPADLSGSCDNEPIGNLAAGSAARRSAIDSMCATLTFPTGATPPTGSCYAASSGRSGSRPLGQGDVVFPPTCQVANGLLGRPFANLRSIEECRAIPLYPAGTSVYGYGAGGQGSLATYTCLGGRWIATGLSGTDSGGDTGGGEGGSGEGSGQQ